MGISAYAGVMRPDGQAVRAEDVNPGDRLANPVTGTTLTVKKVWQGPGVGMCRVGAAGDSVDLTGDQKLMTSAGPLAAREIRPGTILVSSSGQTACDESGPVPGEYMVYDIVPENPDSACLSVNGFFVSLE